MKPLAVDGKRAGPMPRPSPLGRPSGLLSGLSATSGVGGGLPKAGSNADLRALDFKPTAERMDRNRSAMVRRPFATLCFHASMRAQPAVMQVFSIAALASLLSCATAVR
jgi:hypothetical protein